MIPHVGDFSDEESFNPRTDKFDRRKIRVTCPGCKKRKSPMLNLDLTQVDGGWRWVGCDHKEPYTRYQTTCGCGQVYEFTVHTPQ